MLLAAQMTFGWKKEEDDHLLHDTVPLYVADVGEKPTAEELKEGDSPVGPVVDIVSPSTTVTQSSNDPVYTFVEEINEPDYPMDDGPLTDEQIEQVKESVETFKSQPFYGTPSASWPFPGYHEANMEPPVEEKPKEEPIETVDSTIPLADIDAWNKMIEAAEAEVAKERESTLQERLATGETYIDGNGEEVHPDEGTEFPLNPTKGMKFTRTDFNPPRACMFDGAQWIDYIESDESKKKTYMIKEENQQVIKTTNK